MRLIPSIFSLYYNVFQYFLLCPGSSVVSVSDPWPDGFEFDPRLRRTFVPAYVRLSPLQKHVRKVVGGFGKKSCVSTGVRKSGNTCASPTLVIWPKLLTLYSMHTFLTHEQQTAFENIVGKRRNYSWRAISPFPTMFSTRSDNYTPIAHIFDTVLMFAAELEESKVGVLG